MKKPLMWVVFTCVVGFFWETQAEEKPAAASEPTTFGITDGSVPTDPRQTRKGRRAKIPAWSVSSEMPDDTFTFARLRYQSSWLTDYPKSDLNFSFRLQQLTSIQVNPKGALVDIDPEQLRHYPFVYMVDPGKMKITPQQAEILRNYMLNGGFILVDDFWGTKEWEVFHKALKVIFPNREPVELPLEHEIFHTVFPMPIKPQIPSVRFGVKGRSKGITYEWDKPGSEEVHYRAVMDDEKRIMMMICHNTDLGDGWEEEGKDPWYFREFSEKYAYPLGINIVFYALTR